MEGVIVISTEARKKIADFNAFCAALGKRLKDKNPGLRKVKFANASSLGGFLFYGYEIGSRREKKFWESILGYRQSFFCNYYAQLDKIRLLAND